MIISLRVSTSDLCYMHTAGPEVIKRFFMLNSAKHEIYPVHNVIATNCLHIHLYQQDK